jgi:hypothetical protein
LIDSVSPYFCFLCHKSKSAHECRSL